MDEKKGMFFYFYFQSHVLVVVLLPCCYVFQMVKCSIRAKVKWREAEWRRLIQHNPFCPVLLVQYT